MTITLRPIQLPDFEVPHARPEIPAEIYAKRADAAYARAGKDWLVVYADREHLANMAFLTGFEPRFEEALLILGKAAAACWSPATRARATRRWPACPISRCCSARL